MNATIIVRKVINNLSRTLQLLIDKHVQENRLYKFVCEYRESERERMVYESDI